MSAALDWQSRVLAETRRARDWMERAARDALAWTRDGEDGIRREIALVLSGAAVLLLGLGGWAAMVSLAGAVIAEATIVVDSNLKKVQHQTGGVIAELNVRNGDRVKAGDLLLRLDPTVARANLQLVSRQLDQSSGRAARLKAELADGDLITPAALAARTAEPEVAEILAEERRLFESRRTVRDGRRGQLAERAAQLANEIRGLEAQQEAKEREIALVTSELTGLRDLYRKNLVQLGRVNALEREAARLEGERGQLIASVAQVRGKVAETRLQILQIDQDLRAEGGRELRELQAKDAELSERAVAARDQLLRLDIRSPYTGTVHQLAYHTVGGVVAPGDAIMLIVPDGDTLVLEAKVDPRDIDRVAPGQSAIVRLSAFDMRTTPEFRGKVVSVAPDLTEDQRHDRSFYAVRVQIDQVETGAEGLRLVPGMPAEVHLITGSRTALSYLLKPLTDQFAHAFRER